MNGGSAERSPAPGEQGRPSRGPLRERIRTFVAVTTEADLHRACSRLASESCELRLRWAQPESLHLTLRFWGDLEVDAVPAVCEGLQRAAAASIAFIAAVKGLGCFPNVDRPRVLWMGLEDPEGQLVRLRRRIDASLAVAGVPSEEKPFRPHLTVARSRGLQRRRELDTFLDRFKNQTFGQLAVSRLHLMRSDLSGKGAVHTRLHSFPLQRDTFAAQSPLAALKEGG